jgi:hypothetical protein
MTLHPDLVGFELTVVERPREHPRPGWSSRLRARVSARRLDRRVDEGVHALPGSALAAHYHRLTTPRERADVARALKWVLRDAVEGPDLLIPRVPVRTPEVLRNRDVIEDIRMRLIARRPVRARGVARLRLLIADGRGPLYRPNSGSLTAALRGVLAAL